MRKYPARILAAIMMVMLFGAWGAAAGQPAARAVIDISGHPFRGPANATVTMVVFSDYL